MEQQDESDDEHDAEGDDGEMVYPPELLEFLEDRVQEHGDNWEAISGDFMDIAMELDEALVQRATEAFSPEALRRRWLQLLEEEGLSMGSGDEHHCADEEKQDGGPEAPDAEDAGDRGQDEAPAAVVEDPVRKRVEVMPSRPGWMDLMDSGAEAPSGFSIFKDSLKEQIDKIYLEVQSKLPTTVMDGDDDDEEETEEEEDKEDGPEQHVLRADAEDTDEGRKPTSSAADANSARFDSALAVADEEASLAEHEKEKQKLMMSTSQGSADTSLRDARVHRGTRGRRGDVEFEALDDTYEDDDGDEAASIGGDSSSADEDFLQMRQNMKQSSLEILSSPSAPASSSSAPLVFAPKPRLPEQPRQEARARPARAQAQQASVPQKFVTLELQASSEDETSSGHEDEDAQEGGSEAGDNSGEYAEDEEHLRVMRRLLARAPEGEGAWDVWLEATQAWPRLQLRLGAPTFFQHNGDLRVSFDASKLRGLLEEEQSAVIAQRQHQKEQAAQLSSRTAEFVREAEKRREELAKRIGSFVLSSQRSEIKAT